ncbi:MAG: GNAT family N-acetyltransferase [Anaerolineales bacterium]|nr:GNAT family N-acetyltransferase [Anaerolineales bacterium]
MPDMLVRLYDLGDSGSYLSQLAEQGIIVRRAMAYEKATVVAWVARHFSAGWSSECDVTFSRTPVSCYLATNRGRIMGFACYDSVCKDFFGPIGVLECERTRGIGKGLLLACLEAMRTEGYAYAIIGGVGPKEFYAKAVGATEIPGSTPGIYRDMLEAEQP